MSTPQSKATQKYHKKVYDQLIIQVKKGQRDYIKSIAAEYGYTLAGFVREAINDKIRSLSINDKRRVLIKVLSLILDKKINKSIDFLAGIENFLNQPSASNTEPQEGHIISSADDNNNI